MLNPAVTSFLTSNQTNVSLGASALEGKDLFQQPSALPDETNIFEQEVHFPEPDFEFQDEGRPEDISRIQAEETKSPFKVDFEVQKEDLQKEIVSYENQVHKRST